MADHDIKLYDNQGAGPGTYSTDAQYTVGHGFKVDAGAAGAWEAYAVRWYRPVAGSGSPPSGRPLHVGIWDTTTSSVVATASDLSADDNSVGWHEFPLDAPVGLVKGRQYVVAYQEDHLFPYTATSSNLGPPAPLVHDSNVTSGSTSAWQYPTSVGSFWWFCDVAVRHGTGSGEGGGGATTGDLAAWLSADADVQTHEADGLPWKTYQAVTDGDTGLAAIAGLLGDALGASWSSATDTLHQIGTKVGSILTAVTTGPLPGITGLEDLANTIIDKLDAAATYLQNPTAGWPGAASGRQVFPATGWTMVDEVDFTFQKSWDMPADLYVLTVSTFPVDIVDVDVDGAHWRPRLGWWAVRNGDGFGARSFVDWETSYLETGGRRMNGVVIRTQPACECHVQAWVLA